MRHGDTAFESRHVEQLLDQIRQPPGFPGDHGRELAAPLGIVSVVDPLASPAAMIAVIGFRRSCDTERRIVVFR